jgi:hypothetical protein
MGFPPGLKVQGLTDCQLRSMAGKSISVPAVSCIMVLTLISCNFDVVEVATPPQAAKRARLSTDATILPKVVELLPHIQSLPQYIYKSSFPGLGRRNDPTPEPTLLAVQNTNVLSPMHFQARAAELSINRDGTNYLTIGPHQAKHKQSIKDTHAHPQPHTSFPTHKPASHKTQEVPSHVRLNYVATFLRFC